jgi:activating signal cointegrator complex subunit 2
MTSLPAFALFPLASWRAQISADDWTVLLTSWTALIDSHLSLPEDKFSSISIQDDSIPSFLTSFLKEAARGGADLPGQSPAAKKLVKSCFSLTARILQHPSPPSTLAQWDFLADSACVFGKKRLDTILSKLVTPAQVVFDRSLADLKKLLVKNLDAGLTGDLKITQEHLSRVNHLIHGSPSVAAFFLAGSDFLDGLISCFKIMNPPLRKVIITTTYLCLMGLVQSEQPKTSMLTDQLYSLKAAAEAHKRGPTNANDSLVAELVTATPLLQQVQSKLETIGSVNTRTMAVLTDLASYRKAGGFTRPKTLVRRKINKGKGLDLGGHADENNEMHIHRMSQISQVQDLFPTLGSGFITKLLNEYGEDTEQVIAHLLDDSLPAHLRNGDRTEQL